MNAAVKTICDIIRRSNCAGALQYVPELTWILFLRILDEREEQEGEHAEALGVEFRPSLESPYRWRDWAAPGGPKRKELEAGTLGSVFGFVNGTLLPHLRQLRDSPGSKPRQEVISEIMCGVERTRIDTERNFHVSAGAGVKTNLLFFTRRGPTEKVWYYDLSDVKVGKKTPLTLDRFDDFLRLLPSRSDSERSWTVTRAEIEAKEYDLKAVNPNARSDEDTRSPEELLDLIEAKGKEVADAVAKLRELTGVGEKSARSS